MSKRVLTPEDLAVWRQVTKQIKRSAPDVPVKTDSKKTIPTFPSRVEPSVNPSPSAGKKPNPIPTKARLAPSFLDAPAKTSPNMDRRNFQRLLKGQMEIDGTLDLHGMTADQAKHHLTRYISQAHRQGWRMILVITGKGKSKTDEFNRPVQGVLRQNLPDWLRGQALAHLVLQVSTAQPKHGGAGAFYVYLRRKR